MTTLTRRVRGETISVEVEEMSTVKQIRWAAMAPDALMETDPKKVEAGLEVVEYMVKFGKQNTKLTEDVMNKFTNEELMELLSDIISVSFGNEPSFSSSDYKLSDDVEFNENGAVDLEDWR